MLEELSCTQRPLPRTLWRVFGRDILSLARLLSYANDIFQTGFRHSPPICISLRCLFRRCRSKVAAACTVSTTLTTQDAAVPLRSVPNPSSPFRTPPIPPPHTAGTFAVTWFMHHLLPPGCSTIRYSFSFPCGIIDCSGSLFSHIDSNSAAGLSFRRSSRAFRPQRSEGSGCRIRSRSFRTVHSCTAMGTVLRRSLVPHIAAARNDPFCNSYAASICLVPPSASNKRVMIALDTRLIINGTANGIMVTVRADAFCSCLDYLVNIIHFSHPPFVRRSWGSSYVV